VELGERVSPLLSTVAALPSFGREDRHPVTAKENSARNALKVCTIIGDLKEDT
jgi:hypothetical protein